MKNKEQTNFRQYLTSFGAVCHLTALHAELTFVSVRHSCYDARNFHKSSLESSVNRVTRLQADNPNFYSGQRQGTCLVPYLSTPSVELTQTGVTSGSTAKGPRVTVGAGHNSMACTGKTLTPSAVRSVLIRVLVYLLCIFNCETPYRNYVP